MELNEETLTQLVIEWIEKEDYSKNHWKTVALEKLDQSDNNQEKAIILFAEELSNFHTLYKTKVVQENNLLFDILTHNLDKVQWILVAQRFY